MRYIIILGGLLCVTAFVVLGTWYRDTSGSIRFPEDPSTFYQIDHTGEVPMISRYLKSSLKDPGSYEPVAWSKVDTLGEGRFIVSHTYRAKNGFGGMTMEKIYVTCSNYSIISIQSESQYKYEQLKRFSE